MQILSLIRGAGNPVTMCHQLMAQRRGETLEPFA
jgi:hypothetical protein